MKKIITLFLITSALMSCNNEQSKKGHGDTQTTEGQTMEDEGKNNISGKYLGIESNNIEITLDFKGETSVLIDGQGTSYVRDGQVIRINTEKTLFSVFASNTIFTIKNNNTLIREGTLGNSKDGTIYSKVK